MGTAVCPIKVRGPDGEATQCKCVDSGFDTHPHLCQIYEQKEK